MFIIFIKSLFYFFFIVTLILACRVFYINPIIINNKINYGIYFYHLWSCNFKKFHKSAFKSQSNEDKILYEAYYKYPSPYLNGIFIEIGALDGLKISNSYFFEKSLGWKGLLIEGSSSNCKLLKKNQYIRSRSEVICAAICDNETVTFIENDDIGGIENELPQRLWANFSASKKTITKCVKLSSLISFYGITHIDIFFLDIEGSELMAIKSFDFSIIVNYWIIEFNNKSKAEHKQIMSILYMNGYTNCNIFVGEKNKCFTYKNYKRDVIKLRNNEMKYYNNNGIECQRL